MSIGLHNTKDLHNIVFLDACSDVSTELWCTRFLITDMETEVFRVQLGHKSEDRAAGQEDWPLERDIQAERWCQLVAACSLPVELNASLTSSYNLMRMEVLRFIAS